MKSPSHATLFAFVGGHEQNYSSFAGSFYDKYKGGGSRVAGWRDGPFFWRDMGGMAGLAQKFGGIAGWEKKRDRDIPKR